MSDDTAYEKYTLKLHQCSPCFYELLCDGETIPHNYSWITFDDGSLGREICDLLNKEANEVKRMKDIVKGELLMVELHIEHGNDPRSTYVRTGTFIRLMKEILGED